MRELVGLGKGVPVVADVGVVVGVNVVVGVAGHAGQEG